MERVDEERHPGETGDSLRQQERLIEFPGSKAGRVERDGGDPIELSGRQCLDEQTCQRVGQRGLFLILESLDRLGEDSFVGIGGDGPREGRGVFPALRAVMIGAVREGRGGGKGGCADRTTGFRQRPDRSPAAGAKREVRFSIRNREIAMDAGARIDQVEELLQEAGPAVSDAGHSR